jgi:hypothetical protein
MPLKKGWRTLPSADFDPDATVRDFLGIGLRFPDQRLEPRLQILG